MRPVTVLLLIFFALNNNAFSQDQTLEWFTYFGDNDSHNSRLHVAIAPDGSVYTAGSIESDGLINGSGIHQAFYAGGTDVYLAKFSESGSLIWCTNFGGAGLETCHGLEINSQGKPVIIGSTDSDTGIAFGESHQSERAGSGDDYIAVFEPTGEIAWSTYFGGENAEDNPKLTLDASDNIIISGLTYSEDLATDGAHQQTISNIINPEVFIAQFTSTGVLNWCTYFGSEETEVTESISSDSQNNIIVALRSESNEGLATENAYQSQSINQSPVLAKFSSEGELLWSTYVSGEGDETNSSVVVDGNDDIYLAGGTESMENIASENAFQEVNVPGEMWPGGTSIYIMKFNPSGNRIWGTYFGGLYSGIEVKGMSGLSQGIGFLHNSYFTDDLIFGESPFQTEIEGQTDAIIVRFSAEGGPVWATAFGGEDFDAPIDLRWHENQKFAIAGLTRSNDFYANESSWQGELAGGLNDSFIALFQDNVLSQNNIYRESAELTAYPNPSISGRFKLDWKLENLERADLTIYDLYGREIQNIRGYQRNAQLNLNLSNGIYFVGLKYRGNIHTKKVLILR